MGCRLTRHNVDNQVSAFPYPAFASEDGSCSDTLGLGYDVTSTGKTGDLEAFPHFKPQLKRCMTRSIGNISGTSFNAEDLYDNALRRSVFSDITPLHELNKGDGVSSIETTSVYRPDRIILIRHGESEANVDRKITARVPDHAVHLTARGREQALKCGEMLAEIVGGNSVAFIVSPYVRTRETFHGIARSFGPVEELNVRLDVQIREQDHGNFDRPEMKEFHKEKGEFGQFYYRFPEGESMADVYDRASIFLESLYRRWEFSREKNLVIVSHGLYILVLLMRLFRYSLDELYSLEPLRNCEMTILEHPANVKFYDISYTWCPGLSKDFAGLRKRPAETLKEPQEVWNGDPDAEQLVSKPSKRPVRMATTKLFGRSWQLSASHDTLATCGTVSSFARKDKGSEKAPPTPTSPGGNQAMRASLSLPARKMFSSRGTPSR